MTSRLYRAPRALALFMLLAVLLCAAVQAESAAGSLHILLTGQDGTPTQKITVLVYRVADTDGTLTEDFAAAGIDAGTLFETEQEAKTARRLAAFAAEHGCSAEKQPTDATGEATFAPLAEGIYLVRCAEGQSVVFPAFLVHLPLELEGKLYYDVDAFPKSEPAPTPPSPPAPRPDDAPNLPQTGWDPLPTLLLAFGGLVILCLGVIELIRAGKANHG